MIDYTREILSQVTWDVSATQVVSYDTQFDLGNFYLSTLTLKDPRLLTDRGNHPTVPAIFVVHERKLIWDHELAIKIFTDLVPELKKKKFISSSDDEFTSLLERNFKGSFVAKDENHMVKKIERAVRNRKGTAEEVSFYKNEYRTLLRQDTREEYEHKYNERKKGWKKSMQLYWKTYIHPHIDKCGLWSAREIGYERVKGLTKEEVPRNIFDSQQAESINSVMAKRCGENDVDLGDIVQIVRDYQRAFMTEVAKARMIRSKGQYSLIEKYRTENDDQMAQELLNKVVGPSHSDIEQRARQEREREELEATVRMQGRGSA